MTPINRLKAIFNIVLEETKSNSAFRGRLESVFKDLAADTQPTKKTNKPGGVKGGRRRPGVVDPFRLYQESPEHLKEKLVELTVEQLKDIISEHAMDNSKLAVKWRDPQRLITLIIETVGNRLAKGDAFRA